MTSTIERTTLHLYVDTREQRPPPWPEGVTTERFTLDTADYSTPSLLHVARVERKSLDDFAASLGRERERFDREVERLRQFRYKCIVVEGDLSDFFEGRVQSQIHVNAIVQSIASFYARAQLPVLFAHDAVTAGRLIAGVLLRIEEQFARPQGSSAT